MTKSLLALCGIAVIGLAACESKGPTLPPPGQYSKTETSVDQYGTETEKTTDTNVYYDQHGNKKAVQETTTSRDPKGLFNKTQSTTTKTYN